MYLKPLSAENKKNIAIDRDESSFKAYFVANYGVLKSNAISFIKDKQLAEDVVSEVLWKIWYLGPDLMNIANVEGYLLRAIKNKCLNLLRIRQVILTDGTEYQDTLIDKNTPEQILISTESIQRIQRAVEGLPPKTKEAFKLVKEERKTYLETAEVMGISKKTVDRHIQIALEKLWSCIKEKK